MDALAIYDNLHEDNSTALTLVDRPSNLIPKPATPRDSVDLQAIATWVALKCNSEHTQRAFEIEAKRWLAFLIHLEPNAWTWLNRATSTHAAAYVLYLKNEKGERAAPFPADVLRRAGYEDVAQKTKPGEAPKPPSPRQPFKKEKLSHATYERAITVLKTMYKDMRDMDFPTGIRFDNKNPFAATTAGSADKDKNAYGKALNARERHYIKCAFETMQANEEPRVYHQHRWIWNALRWTALRRFELANAKMGDISHKYDESKNHVWILSVVGKGKTEPDTITLPDIFMEELKIYRAQLGMPALPQYDAQGILEDTPLVLPIRGKKRRVHPDMIYQAVKKLMELGAEEAKKQAGATADEIEKYMANEAAARLRSFASHSARHTCITTIVNSTGDITQGKVIARHASIATTMRYKAPDTVRLKETMDALAKSEGEKDWV